VFLLSATGTLAAGAACVGRRKFVDGSFYPSVVNVNERGALMAE